MPKSIIISEGEEEEGEKRLRRLQAPEIITISDGE